MKITSRNVNGIRAVLNKGFCEWVKKDNPDILCLQETKATYSQIPIDLKYVMRDYECVWHSGKRLGYAGTAIFYKKNFKIIWNKNEFPNFPKFNEDWRVTEIRFKHGNRNVALINIYCPHWWPKADWTEMLPYKLEFYDDIIGYINELKNGGNEVIIGWDFNICHEAIDISRPKQNEKLIMFLPVERAKMDELQSNWYTDVFRYFNPELKEKYTRRSYSKNAKMKNIWKRLDYFRISNNFVKEIKDIQHHEDTTWSDHCPISLIL